MIRPSVLVRALREPERLGEWTLADWDLIVRQARSANLLARLACVLDERGVASDVPPGPAAHLQGARTLATAQEEAVRREVAHLAKALARTGVQIVLLKGAAYVFGGLPPARGRLFSDIDVLVPDADLAQVEAALMLHGWASTHHDAYDQRYYRKWMHELPPLRHVSRNTVVDVHHRILPRTARLKPDSGKLLAASQRVPGWDRLRLLSPSDMVVHSAVHLFFNEEFSNGLRDLVDLDSLLRHYCTSPGFWSTLVARAEELELARPLHYALRYARDIIGTPVPAEIVGTTSAPPKALRRLMDTLFVRALQPDHASTRDWLTPLARRALYVRAHWLRMPPLMLARHLTVKAFRRSEEPVPDH